VRTFLCGSTDVLEWTAEEPKGALRVSPTDKIRIFVASPGDVQDERDQLGQVVQELNTTLSALVPERGLVLELVKWETHARPGTGS
jgi:hypothetical protein